MKYYYYPHVWPSSDVSNLSRERCYEIEYGRVEIDPTDEWEYEMLAEKCADDYRSNHDGWEHESWVNDSLPFILYDSKMNLIGTFDVYLEYEPSFSATRKKNEK